jgi:two-component SAPR family response regulator
MITLRNSKLNLTFFNIIFITSNKNYFSISININNIKYFVKYFTKNTGFLTHSMKIYILFQEI